MAVLTIGSVDFAFVLGCCANEYRVIADIAIAIPTDMIFIKIYLKVNNHLFIMSFRALELKRTAAGVPNKYRG
jgi:hypothetical protein